MNGRGAPGVAQFPRRRTQPFDVVYPIRWEGHEPEPVRWLVRNAIPRGTVCLFSGDSGLGKSLLMQQLQTCAAINEKWLGCEVAQVRSFGFYCEDPINILHLRQADICRQFNATLSDLERMSLVSRVGLDNTLMDFNRRTDDGQVTAVYSQIKDHVRDFGAELIIIDTVAHTFNGNENIRAQVTAFVGALQQIASETDGAVVLCAHPSVSSMASGTGYSGSTAWRATVRAHIYLKRPKGYDDEAEDADSDIRVLKTMKSNWGPGAGTMRLRWNDGIFALAEPEREPVAGHMGRLMVERAVYEGVLAVTRNGDRIASGRQANNNLAKVLSRLPSCKRFVAVDLFAAADRLIEEGRICRVTAGRKGKYIMLLRTDQTRYPDEFDEAEGPRE